MLYIDSCIWEQNIVLFPNDDTNKLFLGENNYISLLDNKDKMISLLEKEIETKNKIISTLEKMNETKENTKSEKEIDKK